MPKTTLQKEVLGKSLGTWLHYPIVLGIITLILYLGNLTLFSLKGFLLTLLIFIISDVAIEKFLEVK